jgi:hypothetical protein
MLSSLILSLVMSAAPIDTNINNINIEEAGTRKGQIRIGTRKGQIRIGTRKGQIRI